MKLLIVFAVALAVAGAKGQSPATASPPTVTSPATAGDTAPAPSPALGRGVYRVGGAVKPPVVVKMVNAKFSKEARKKKFSGDVLLRMLVDENGLPQEVTVVRSVGHGLDEEALKAAQQYRFKPATKDGQPVKVVINLDVNFRIF